MIGFLATLGIFFSAGMAIAIVLCIPDQWQADDVEE